MGLDRFNLESEGLKVVGWLDVALPRLLVNAVRVSAEEPEKYGVLLEATEPVLPGPRRSQLELDRIRGDATVIFEGPLNRQALNSGIPFVDAVDLRSLRFERDGQSADVAGRLGVDRQGYLSGKLTVAFSSPALLPEFLEATRLADRLDPLVSLAISSLANQSGPLKVGVTFRNGETLVGPLQTRDRACAEAALVFGRARIRGPAEVRRRDVLPGIDDPPADRAGSGEIIEEHVAVAGADRPLKREKLFGETAEDLQRCVAVMKEHVAPHRWVRRGDAGEVAKTGSGIFDDFALGDAAHIVSHTHHGVGDQVRGMGGDCEHEIVVIGLHDLHVRAKRLPEGCDPVDILLRRVW